MFIAFRTRAMLRINLHYEDSTNYSKISKSRVPQAEIFPKLKKIFMQDSIEQIPFVV